MAHLTDKELIEELQQRFNHKKKALKELSTLTKQLQEVNNRLHESEKLKSHFLSNIRNEMNNPVASILGLSKNIQLVDPQQWEKTKLMASLIHAEAFNLDFQLKNIFAAAELEAGEVTLETSIAFIDTIVHGIINMHKHQADARQVHIEFTNETPQGFTFKTDPAKLQLILSNIMANAIEHSPAASALQIRLWKKTHAIFISIQDVGAGISKADQNLIFNRFTQLDNSTTKLHKGHGLGLSVTKALLEILNGQIEVCSNNHGTTFTVSVQEFQTHSMHFAPNANEFFFNEAEHF
jgi:signal transduction histidine kinase